MHTVQTYFFSGDILAQTISNYVDIESHNPSSREGLRLFAANFAAIQDYRNAEVARIEDRVVKPLSEYGETCRNAKVRGYLYQNIIYSLEY